MEPRRHGFSGTPGSANPVLCLGRTCYVSGGPDYDAERLSRWKVLGPVNSLGRRAGPCRNQLTCVFRNVDLGAPSAAIQPIDMGLLHHDRRDIKQARADTTCEVIAQQLLCAAPLIGHGYRAWIVPERIAAKAGPRALRAALDNGLPSVRSAKREASPIKSHALPKR
jgi:hypothetical protein